MKTRTGFFCTPLQDDTIFLTRRIVSRAHVYLRAQRPTTARLAVRARCARNKSASSAPFFPLAGWRRAWSANQDGRSFARDVLSFFTLASKIAILIARQKRARRLFLEQGNIGARCVFVCVKERGSIQLRSADGRGVARNKHHGRRQSETRG